MSNLRILAKNIADTATVTASPAAVSTLPVTNLQTQQRKQTFRSASLESGSPLTGQQIKLTWSAAQKINMIALMRHNLRTTGTIRVHFYSDAAWTTEVYSTSATAFSTSGLATDIDTYTDADYLLLKNSAIYFAELTTVQSAIIVLTDSTNPDGYFEASRLFVGKYFETTYDPPFGGSDLTIDDMGVQERADSGSLITDKREKYRKLNINAEFIPEADLDDLLAIARYLGKEKDCFVSLYPGEAGVKELYHQLQAKLVQSPTFNPYFLKLHRAQFQFEEA
jgi:hypothetical protein